MDRFDVISFADLTGPDGGDWVKIGGGSFGVVFKGEYLGTQVAIKEVLPNNTYDVEKYFERECVLMKEARHPNITQYIGLTKSPGPDGRIYIISEFVGGNLRGYIADSKKPFPWRLRMSFAMDIARALAYLHARNCMHRDLKGENLLIAANDRIKVCDFGFARIAARNEDEMRRISYCGTDGYMSPEILLGLDFGLPSDVFSLGVIFAEIASRHLVDSQTLKRTIPTFGLEADEVREMASEGCPEAFIQLILDCVEEDARDRPDMRQVVVRLRTIEREVLLRDEKENRYAIGSVRGATVHSIMGTKLKRMTAPRLPSFNGAVKVGSHSRTGSEEEASSSGDELEEALVALEKIGIDPDDPKKQGSLKASSTFKVSGHGNPWWSDDTPENLPSINNSWLPSGSTRRGESQDGLLHNADYADSDYSTSVIRSSKMTQKHAPLPIMEENNASSTMTVRQESNSGSSRDSSPKRPETHSVDASFMTAHTHRHDPSLAMATLASAPSEFYKLGPIHHRFTLVKNSTKRPASIQATATAAAGGNGGSDSRTANLPGTLLPPAVMLSNALAKCWVCGKRIGWKPFMDCDDCPYKAHVGCADLAPPTCQELMIPGHFAQPVLTPQNASRRNSKALEVADSKAISAAAAALKAAGATTPEQEAKSNHSPGGGGGLLKGKGMKKMFGANGAATPPRRGSLAA